MKLSSFSKCVFLLVFAITQHGNLLFSQCPNYSVTVGNSSDTYTRCPFGFPTNLTAQLKQFSTPIPGATYTWQPGNLAIQNPIVNPIVTTVYTVTATKNGCNYTNTTIINVMPVTAPTISYTPFPYNSTAPVPATFPVTQTGIGGGAYSIAPLNPSITINSSTGLITAWGSSYGTYTVTYHTSPFGESGGWCEDYYATTVITLQNSDCPISISGTSYTLCPNDKVIFTSTVNFPNGGVLGTVYGINWSTITAASNSTLSCYSCNSPTLTFDGVPSVFVITGLQNRIPCGSATVNLVAKEFCEKEEIIGCCFSNYGAAVWIGSNTTYLNIYCNLLNELGNTPSASPALQKGEFQNDNGTVRVLLDWIHNAKNNLYTVPQGTTSVFGADEKIKGNSNTQFYELWLNGNGTKSIWIDEYANSTVDLTSNVLSTQNFIFFMKNPLVAILRSNGYVSAGVKGYLSRVLGTTSQSPTQEYLYPLGASASNLAAFRYRPLVIGNNSAGLVDEVSANFMNMAPSVANDPAFVHTNTTLTNVITNQAPNVLQLNNAFYHKIKNTLSTNTVTSNVYIRSYYFSSDGQFQSLAEWEKDPNQTLDWWGSTPGASASNTLSTNPGTPGMIYAMANGTLSFNHKPFTLSRGGFFLNTNNFGNAGGAGTIFSVTAIPPGSGPTPTGGGLGNPYGTGSSSGNGGNGGNTIFSPNPVAGEYVMTVSPSNTCATGGRIRFVIDQNGNISPSSVKYGISPGIYLGELSEAVYTIDNINSGITFSATPRDLMKNCVNSITVTTSLNNDHIINSGETIVVTLPAVSNPSNTITYSQFKIFDKANTQVYSSGSNLNSGVTTLSPGLTVADIYRFELQVTASTAPPITEIIRGQLIVK